MSKDTAIAKSSLLREVFQLGLYKRSQGRITRQATFGVITAVFALAAWRLNDFMHTMQWGNWVVQYAVPTLLLVAGGWFSFRLVNLPRFADFLIAVEAEMYKVSWPTRTELYRHSVVVIVVIFLLVVVLYAYDIIWRFLFQLLGVLR